MNDFAFFLTAVICYAFVFITKQKPIIHFYLHLTALCLNNWNDFSTDFEMNWMKRSSSPRENDIGHLVRLFNFQGIQFLKTLWSLCCRCVCWHSLQFWFNCSTYDEITNTRSKYEFHSMHSGSGDFSSICLRNTLAINTFPLHWFPNHKLNIDYT